MTDPDVHQQLELLRAQVRPPPKPNAQAVAAHLPVARVVVDVPLPHLDWPFDYLVPADLDDQVVPGCRVSVRFSGKLVRGFVLERIAESEHEGSLGRIAKAVSPEVVLRPDIIALVRQVADRYAGTFSDVVRLAVPPRHARTEQRVSSPTPPGSLPPLDISPWERYDGGAAFARDLAAGRAPRACWGATPGAPPEQAIAEAVLATLHAGRGAVVCVPDARDLARLDGALTSRLGGGHHVTLSADLGPAARYTAFLALARGHVKAVIGTRGAAFAPVHGLGLVAIWDDGDDLHAEQRAPYPHAREVLLTRALEDGVAVLVGGHARTCEAQQLVETRWCHHLGLPPAERRKAWARVVVAGTDDRSAAQDPAAQAARLPHDAFALLRTALVDGPVLVQVPRLGYRTSLACATCRTPARCRTCHGPLAQVAAGEAPRCRWCGEVAADWACAHCGARRLRAPVVGERRTAEELGRAFPQIPVRVSAGDSVAHKVDNAPAIVVATPGAEPVAADGYAAALLMDTWLLLGRPDLRTEEEAIRRWFNAAALVRPSGRVLAVGDPTAPALQALVRTDPVGHAARELGDRRQAHFPPAVRLASIEAPADVLDALAATAWPAPAEVLGPVPLDAAEGTSRLIVRVPRRQGFALAGVLQQLQGGRSLRKELGIRVRIDPVTLG